MLFALVFLVFFQLLTSLIESTYSFGLLSVDIPPETVFVLFLLSPLLFLFFPGWLSSAPAKRVGLMTGSLMFIAWGAAQFLDSRGQMIAAGVGVGAALLFLPMLYRLTTSFQLPLTLAGGLAFGVLAHILLRIENFGNGKLPGEGNLFAIIGILLLGLLEMSYWYLAPSTNQAQSTSAPEKFPPLLLKTLGIASILILLYFGFTTPVVLARWSGADSYPLFLGASALASGAMLLVLFGPKLASKQLPRPLLLTWNALFGLSLLAALLPYQTAFPRDPALYPLAAAPFSDVAFSALLLAVLLHPVLYVDFALLAGSSQAGSTSPRALAGGLAIAALYQLLLVFAQVFTTVYAYIPVVGPLFRDRFWLVICFPALLIFIAVLAAPGRFAWNSSSLDRRWPVLSAALFTILALAVSFFTPKPVPSPAGSGSLRVMTYNLQQGYRADGQIGYRDQLEAIRVYAPDILGLQETDTARIANGNHDLVGFLSGNLNMYSYYGPNPITGTFGIALLSRYPIADPQTYTMYSSGEQTAVIVAKITVSNVVYTVVVTHLGNGGPLIQQQQVLELARSQPNVILMGDLNFRPSSEQYRQTAAGLKDGWLSAASRQLIPPGQNPDTRIDHFFVSPNLNVGAAFYIGKGPSDHPAIVIEILTPQ